MATPFPFGSGNVLTASQLNAITTLPVSTKTANHTLTISDLGSRVVMNSGSSTSITVNTSIFAASDVVEITNIGAGVCTITSGTCTVTSTGSLALAQNASGKLVFISASAAIYVAGDVAAGLVFISGTTFSAASTVSLPASTFSATYANYRIVLDISAASVDSAALRWRMRAAGTDSTAGSYLFSVSGSKADGLTFVGANGQTDTSGIFIYVASVQQTSCVFDILGPQATQNTKLLSIASGRSSDGTAAAFSGAGNFNATTSFDAMTFFPNSGTITGSYKVYGYANS